MDLAKRKKAFLQLGDFLQQFTTTPANKGSHTLNADFFDSFQSMIQRAEESNGWFTAENVQLAIGAWANNLQNEPLEAWLKAYEFPAKSSKKIGLITAGNIPLVGFHDLLCVLISGHDLIIKLSKKDHRFMFFILQLLMVIEPEFKNKIHITEGRLENFDAVIATGSGNTARYFEYYFGKYPHIIRKNRNSVALITGEETDEELGALGKDVFRYFGLGCRNVSKLLIPENYDLDRVFKALYPYRDLIHHKKYENNYDYNKAVFMMSRSPLLDNGFMILKEDTSYSSPIGCLFYEYYHELDEAKQKLSRDYQQIQCIVAKPGITDKSVNFGETQEPGLSDYADGVDTMRFLLEL